MRVGTSARLAGMGKNWFIQGVITNFVWWLLAVSGGAVVALLARYASSWAAPARDGLVAFAAIAVGIVGLRNIRSGPKARTTTRNAESQIRSWLDNFRVAVQNDPNQDTYFRLVATMPSSVKIIIGRLKGELDGYVMFRAEITPSAEEQRQIADLSRVEAERMLLEVRLELARLGVTYSGLTLPVSTIALMKRLPISDALTEDLFIDRLDQMEAAVGVIAIITRMGFQRNEVARVGR